MKLQTLLLTFALSFFTPLVLAGANHDHGHGHSHEPVTQEQAELTANHIMSTLVKRGVVDKSWDGIQVKKSEQKNFGGQMEWVISYDNTEITDKEKQTLYIFLTLSGEYLAANYTGQ
jgi:hypothetical protein